METLQKREFYQISGINTTNNEWEREGYIVINFGMVSKILKENLTSLQFAEMYRDFQNLYSFNNTPNHEIWEGAKIKFSENLDQLTETYNKFQSLVFKEKRGGSKYYSVGWENLNSYLNYHSGIFYKWL